MLALSRFLIRPGVQCRHLASHVLGRALRRLPADFEARYGYRPGLVETFVDETRQAGTSFRAANWVRVGQTAGRGRAASNWAVIRGHYRLLDQPAASQITPERILAPTAAAPWSACSIRPPCSASRTAPISTSPSIPAASASA